MEHQIDVEIADPNPTLPPGGLARLAIRIRNGTDQAGRFRLAITGPPPSWIDLGDATDGVRLGAGETATISVALQVPSTAAAASMPMVVSLTADHDPDLGSSVFGAVTISRLAESDPTVAAPEPSPAPAPAPTPIPAVDRPTTEIQAPDAEPDETVAAPSDHDRPTAPLPVLPAEETTRPLPKPSPPPTRKPEIGPVGLSLREAGDAPGSYLVRLRNGGRTDASFALELISDAELDVDLPAGPFPVAEGGSLEVPLRLAPRQPSKTPVPFRVRVLGPDGEILAEASAALAPPSTPAAVAGSRRPWLPLGAVAAVALIALVAAAWFFLLRDDGDDTSERPVLETASSVTIQPRGDKSVVYAREVSDNPDAEWVEIAERDAAALPGLFATLTARSPDQQQVVFVTADDEQLNGAEFWIARADGSDEPRQLASIEQGLWPAPPAWSPDGSRLAFAVREGAALRLVTLPVDGGDPQPIDPTPAGFGPEAFYGANPAPLQWIDSQTLGYYTPSEDGGRQLHQVDIESGRAQVIAAPPVPQQAGDLTTPCLDTAFSQNDPRWSDLTLAPVGESIGIAGCGITAAASVLAAFDTGANPGTLAECLNAEQASAPVDWASVPACGNDAVTFSEPAPFSYEEINRLLSGDWPVIVRLKGGPTGEHFVVVNTGPGVGSGLASDFRVTDPWDGTTWKTLAFFTSKGYVPDALIVYEGQQTNCTVVTGSPPQQVQLISPIDQSVSRDARTFDFEVQGAAPGDVIESSIDDGERIDDEGVHFVTITARREGEQVPYLRQTVAFTIDRTAPQTTAQFDGATDDEESFQGQVAIVFAASDELSAVSRIEYRLDDSEEWQTYSTDTVAQPITVTGAGQHTISFRSVDMAGNEEEPSEREFEIVGDAPAGSPTAEPTVTEPDVTATTTPPSEPTEVVPPVVPATPTVAEATATASSTATPVPASPTASPTLAPATATATLAPPAATPTTAPASPTASPPPPAAPPTATATATTAATPEVTSTREATPTTVPASPIATATIAATATATATATVALAASPTATAEPTSTATPEPTSTSAATPTATATTAPTETATPRATATTTATATATATAQPTATVTPRPTSTATPRATATATPRPTATATPRATATLTPEPTATPSATAQPTATITATATATATPEPTETPSPTAEPTSTATTAPTTTPVPTVPPVLAIPTSTPAPASPTATAAEAAGDCQSPIDSDPGVELTVASDLRLSTTEPGTMRLLGLITNDGEQPVEVIITICLAGTTYQPSALAGAIFPGESAPFVFPLEGDDVTVDHGVAVSGFVITEAEIAVTHPNVVIVDEQMHEPDASHPTMWVTLSFRNDGEITANLVQAAIILYQGNGDLREVRIFNIRLENPEAGIVGLEPGQTAATEVQLAGIRSLSGEYEIRLVGISESADEGTPNDGSQTA